MLMFLSAFTLGLGSQRVVLVLRDSNLLCYWIRRR